MREEREALFNTEGLLAVDGPLLADIKQRARRSATRRFRLCLHHSTDELVQEMIVVHCRDNYSRPHAHEVPFSYVVLEGRLRVVLFDDDGSVVRSIDLAPFGGDAPFAFRVDARCWYMPVCLTPQVVFFETKQGPFRRDVTNDWAPWSPGEDDVEGIRVFREKLGLDVDG